MFNGNYVEIDTVLNEIKKYPFTEELTKREASHKLVGLLRLSGGTMPLIRTYKNIKIDQHKGEMPKEVFFIHGVNNKGNSCSNKGIPMIYSSDIYLSALHSEEARATCGTTINEAEQVKGIYPPTVEADATTVNGLLWGAHIPQPALQPVSAIPIGICENSYTINGMSIDTSFAYGWVEMAYDTVQVDCNGFPMIPDDESFKQAFKYYLLKTAAEPAFYRGDVQRHVYYDIEQQYDWYIGQASNSFKNLSPDQVESMARGLIRILPRNDHHTDGWKSFNKRE